jgi:glycerol-3-phosphate cytidylyltransferase-like family protein
MKASLTRPHSPLKAEPARYRNYYFHREMDHRDVPWARPTDFKTLNLPRPIVLVNGAFDLLHSSHMRLLFAARGKAATLICALDADSKIQKEKGVARPILSFIERASALNYMPLDYIVEIASRRDMDTLMRNLKPDLRVRNEAERGNPSRYPDVPKMLIREGRIHTSVLIDRILRKYAAKKA